MQIAAAGNQTLVLSFSFSFSLSLDCLLTLLAQQHLACRRIKEEVECQIESD